MTQRPRDTETQRRKETFINKKFLLCVSVSLCLCVLFTPFAYGGESSGRAAVADDLAAIRARMSEERAALSAVLKKQGGLLDKLGAIKASIGRAQARLTALARERAVLAAESEALKADADAVGRKLIEQRQRMGGRLRARYRFGRLGPMMVIFGADNFGDLSRRRKYLDSLFASDRRRLDDYNALLVDWKQAGTRLSARQADLTALETVENSQRQALESDKAALDAMLRQIREEKAAHEQVLAELHANEGRLQGLIDTIDRKAAPSATGFQPVPSPAPPPDDGERKTLIDTATAAPDAGFAQFQGRLCAPAAGPVTSTFGKKIHPDFNTVTMQNGIEIGAAAGAPVKAVAPGVVRFASWFNGYGNLVIVDHGSGYYSVYAHLAEIAVAVGQTVERGAALGTVGDTGAMGGPSLYFELRFHKQPLDPQTWLGGCSL
jgi:murein hydrolase activator